MEGKGMGRGKKGRKRERQRGFPRAITIHSILFNTCALNFHPAEWKELGDGDTGGSIQIQFLLLKSS